MLPDSRDLVAKWQVRLGHRSIFTLQYSEFSMRNRKPYKGFRGIRTKKSSSLLAQVDRW